MPGAVDDRESAAMLLVRTRIFFRHCRWALVLMMAWFAFGTLAFHLIDGLPLPAALSSALYLGRYRSWFWDLLLVTKRTRERNRDARIIVRCFQDDFVEILESLGADQVISTSKSAFEEMEAGLRPT